MHDVVVCLTAYFDQPLQQRMVAVYGSFEEVEAARPKAANFRKYAAAVAGAWAVLFVAAVLIVGEYHDSNIACIRGTSLGF